MPMPAIIPGGHFIVQVPSVAGATSIKELIDFQIGLNAVKLPQGWAGRVLAILIQPAAVTVRDPNNNATGIDLSGAADALEIQGGNAIDHTLTGSASVTIRLYLTEADSPRATKIL